MARSYVFTAADTNTASDTMWGLTGATTIRPMIYELVIGSVASPADNAWEFYLQRYTAAGTSTSVTPKPVDPADPACTSTAGYNHSVAPTYTSAEYLLRVAGNQRATFRWVANPGKELKIPNTASNGIGCLSNAVGGSAVSMSFTVYFEE